MQNRIVLLLKTASCLDPWCVLNHKLEIIEASKSFDTIIKAENAIGTHILHAFLSSQLEEAIIEHCKLNVDILRTAQLHFNEKHWNITMLSETGREDFFIFLSFSKRKEKNEAKVPAPVDTLVQDLSHEIRTPLTIILGYVELLLSNAACKTFKKELQTVQQQGNRIQKIVTSLINLYFPLYSQTEQPSSVASISNVIREFLEKNTAPPQRKQILFTPDRIPIRARINILLFNMALQNLVDNAIKFSPKEKKILISTENKTGSFFVHIKDQGKGIPLQFQERIFDRFYRIADTPEKAQGSGFGLGLSITKKIVEFMGGKIQLRSKPLEGSTFSIELPKQVPCPV